MSSPSNAPSHPEPRGPVDSSKVPRYSGAATFARLPRFDEVENTRIAILGAPFDTGVSFRPGTRFGPDAVRQASRLLRPYNPALDLMPFREVQVSDAGDLALNPFDIEEAVKSVEEAGDSYAERDIRLVTLGGDHTIALPLLRAVSKRYGKVALLHFDAHLDTWNTYFGAAYTHGTPFRRAFEEGILDTEALCHVGTRGPLYDVSDLDDDRRFGFGIITSADVYYLGVRKIVESLVERIGDRPVYISIDIDVLDPAHAPGTGTPEAGGMTSRELLEILRGLRDLDIVGADVVEVSPPYDHADMTSVAASHLAYELVSAMAWKMSRERS